jgi:hypothetical protein
MPKIALLITTFMRNSLLHKTLQGIVDNLPNDCIVMVGDQNQYPYSNEKTEYYTKLYNEGKVLAFHLPFDCGLSYARNYLVEKAKLVQIPYCLISADSIQFNEQYNFVNIIEFMENDPKIAKVGFALNHRVPWEFNLELIPGQCFYLEVSEDYESFNHRLYHKVDICKNFFLAKTDILVEIPWDNSLKLCLEENTPVIVKDGYNKIRCLPVSSLFPISSKQNTFSGFKATQIWTDSGWQKIYNISRNKNKKDLLSISSTHGFIETTPDHRFIVNNREKEAKKFNIHDTFNMYPFPPLSNRLAVSIDWAWMLGFFLAEGTCKGSCDRIEFTNQNIEYLKKCEKVFNTLGILCEWYSIPRKDKCHFLRIKSPKLLITYFREFYHRNEKTIPYYIYDFDKTSRESFLKGFYDGDGSKSVTKPLILTQKNATIINGLIWLTSDIYSNYFIKQHESKLGKWFILHLKEQKKKNTAKIKNIVKNKTNSYVYDIECQTHRFCAGIGNILVHNCEHEDHCWRLKTAGYKTYVTDTIAGNYIDSKPSEYLNMRQRMYNEFRLLLLQKYRIKDWIKYSPEVQEQFRLWSSKHERIR